MLVRTEFSFGTAYGSPERVMERLPFGGIIADDTCYGHVPFAKAAKAAHKRAVLGWRVRVTRDPVAKDGWQQVAIVPRTPAGLRDLYAACKQASAQARWFPRLTAEELGRYLGGGAEWLLVALPERYGTPGPRLPPGAWLDARFAGYEATGMGSGGLPLATGNNFYPGPEDREPWAFACPRPWSLGAAPGHVLSPGELAAFGLDPEANPRLLDQLDTPLPRAENIQYGVPDPDAELRAQCEAELSRRPEGSRPGYKERLERELTLIGQKRFADYFLVIGDMIRWAKRRMLVGPARGSSCGSLVCWLTRITEIDPIRHDLLFERFVDENRADLPDIDIDFPDATRHEVVEYLSDKYGAENVAHIGTVLRYKPKSALTDVAKALRIPPQELDALKDVIIERSSGDSRYNDCLRDSLEGLEAGRQLLARHPGIALAMRLEGAAKTSGTHAAGLIICNEPVHHFCAVGKEGTAQIDKKMAEALNILKVDALGLRTLSVIDTACAEAGIERDWLYDMPLEDAAALNILNSGKFSGVFQFEGLALQNLAREMTFRQFSDIAAIGALARPGPLSSGEAMKWIARHEGHEPPTPAHPALEPLTRDTYGVIMYQEQVMKITRELAGFSWKETADIRKLMSARQGNESFDRWTGRFIEGCVERGVDRTEAERIWKAINTFGSWAFNKSHAVAYGMVSYWCCWLKAHHPQAFALGCLSHAKDTESSIALLRELVREGMEFVPFDAERSRAQWSVQDGVLIGPLTGLRGIGEVTAREIELRRYNGMAPRPSHQKLLQGKSVFSELFPTKQRWGHLYDGTHFQAPVLEAADVQEFNRPVIVIGKLVKKNLKDLNEEKNIVRRGGRRIEGPALTLMFMIEDDTDRMMCMVDRFRYERLGAPLVERAALGQWLAVRGTLNPGFRALRVENVRWLE